MGKKVQTIEGIYKQYRNGYGFVLCPDEADIFITEDRRGTAMNNDKVEVKILRKADGARNPEGQIINVIERVNHEIVGTFERDKKFGFVIPDDERLGNDIYVNLSSSLEARSGAKVLVEIIQWPDANGKRPEGKIKQILGYKGTPGLDVNCIIARNNLPFDFPEEVKEASEKIDTNVEFDPKRLDLREELMITIDGEDAKDLDDAVSAKKLSNGNYELGVHIADVSHYVKTNGIIDKEAFKRGTSVYLADRVIPMLPQVLSNGICSLNEKVDRYAMTCIMEITPSGRVKNHRIQPSMINVTRRCSYKEVFKALSEDIIPESLEKCMPLLHDLYAIAKVLNKMRVERGALDFDLPEYKVILNEEGKAVRIDKRERTFAERIIEECMLIANETVSSFLERKEIPSVYRVHELPNEEKLDNVKRVMTYLGKTFSIDGEDIHPKDYQKLLADVEGTEIAQVAQTMILRSMKQANYKIDNLGHFGLASKSYTHFTSPIRRYPDLMVHRLLKYAIGWHDGYNKNNLTEAFLHKACEQSSKMEQKAVETERAVADMKKAEYMEQYIGHAFDGKVNSITSFGMFIEIDNGIDGLVSLATMDDDYYIFDEEHYLLVGRSSNKTYHLGQKVKVTLLHADPEKGQIDFLLGDVDPATIDLRRKSRENAMKSGGNRFGGNKSSFKKKDGFNKNSRTGNKTRDRKGSFKKNDRNKRNKRKRK